MRPIAMSFAGELLFSPGGHALMAETLWALAED